MSAAFVALPGWQTPCAYRPPAFSHSALLFILAVPAVEHAPSASANRTTPPHRHDRIVGPSLSRASPVSSTALGRIRTPMNDSRPNARRTLAPRTTSGRRKPAHLLLRLDKIN